MKKELITDNRDTSIEGLGVRISYAVSDKPFIINGVAIDSDKKPILKPADQWREASKPEYKIEVNRTCRSELYIPSVIAHIITIVEIEYRRGKGPNPTKNNNKNKQESLLFNRVLECVRLVAEDELLVWPAKSTNIKNFAMYRDNIVPFFDRWILQGIIPGDAEYDEVRRYLEEMHIGDTRSEGNPRNAKADTSGKLVAANKISAFLQSAFPELPDLPVFPVAKISRYQIEPIKSLNPLVEYKARKAVEKLIDKNPVLSRAAALVIESLRPSEAAATKSTETINEDGYMWINVIWQEEGGKRIPRLKTDAAYRIVVLSEWGRDVLNKCNMLIEDIDSDDAPITGEEVSAYLKGILLESGLSQKELKDIETEMINYPTYDEYGRPERDVVAYIFRRNSSSKKRTFCGYNQVKLDLSLGHGKKTENLKKFDIRRPENRKILFEENRQYDICSDVSEHPGNKPVLVSDIQDYNGRPVHDEFVLINNTDKDVTIRLIAETQEPNDRCSIQVPHNSIQQINRISVPTDGIRPHTTIIQRLDRNCMREYVE